MSDFNSFYAAYPRKVGKLDAMRAYAKARRIASHDEIMAGVENYKRHLPDEARFIPHASTFLNQGRWMDEYDEPVPRAVYPDCDHEPRCNSKQWCAVVRQRAKEQAS